jgi:hypothetical protein
MAISVISIGEEHITSKVSDIFSYDTFHRNIYQHKYVPIVRPDCNVEAPPVVIFAFAPDEAPRRSFASLANTGPAAAIDRIKNGIAIKFLIRDFGLQVDGIIIAGVFCKLSSNVALPSLFTEADTDNTPLGWIPKA